MALIKVTAKQINRRPSKSTDGDTKTFSSELVTNLVEFTDPDDDSIKSMLTHKKGNGERVLYITETVDEVIALSVDVQQ